MAEKKNKQPKKKFASVSDLDSTFRITFRCVLTEYPDIVEYINGYGEVIDQEMEVAD